VANSPTLDPGDFLPLSSAVRKKSVKLTVWPLVVAVLPTLLLAFSLVRGEHEQILGMSGLLFGVLLVVAGFVAFGIDATLRALRP
jgi:hypothetical protein